MITGRPDTKVSLFVEILCYLGGAGSAISALMSLVGLDIFGFLSNAGMGTASICFGMLLRQYRNKMQTLEMNPQAYQAQPGAGTAECGATSGTTGTARRSTAECSTAAGIPDAAGRSARSRHTRHSRAQRPSRHTRHSQAQHRRCIRHRRQKSMERQHFWADRWFKTACSRWST